MKHFLKPVVVPAVALFSLLWGAAWSLVGETEHTVYFRNSDYELHVYHIRGELPGRTLMIMGGIHNEPGGYLTADLYVDMALKRGNLIVVPRANLPSVVTNSRAINGDMNRQFTPDELKAQGGNYEDKVVAVLKKLMREGDLMLNLHDGSGFFRPTWVSDLKNPMRWGQSIIADDDTYLSPVSGNAITLRQRAMRILDRVNEQIPDPEHRFHFNDTRTGDRDTQHPEMRTSATYFGLTQLGVESYGIETSKEIEPIALKIKYQSLVINAFMDDLGIVPQNPKIAIDPPRLEYLLVSVDGEMPHGIPNGKTFSVRKGSRISIEHIAANYERGMIADIVGVGGINDIHRSFVVDKPLKIKVNKDQFPCGEVYIRPEAAASPAAAKSVRITEFLLKVGGKDMRVANGDAVTLSPGNILTIEDVVAEGIPPRDIVLNFVGFVPPGKKFNDGEDRHHPIGKESLLSRFSKDRKGKEYSITGSSGQRELGRITVIYEP